jgi:hypothetical protein
MSYVTVEVEIDHGRIIARGPDKLPETGLGLLTIFQPGGHDSAETASARKRVELPLILGDGKVLINPTPEQLDASLWRD